MARGLPAVWSGLIASVLAAIGGYLYLDTTALEFVPLEASPHQPTLGAGLIAFGAFVMLVGLYVQIIAPPPPTLRDDESLVDTRHPSQRVARVKVLASVPLFAAAGYLFYFTIVPYVYPTVAFLLGLYALSNGLYTYWANSLTTYYVTDRRVISVYRFLSITSKELPLGKIRGIQEQRSFVENVVGLGNVRIASGGGGETLEIVMQNIERSTEFADELRNLV